ncbi:MAG TPA: diacylglycerol kinase family protein [Geminicoccus sp.]|uniref:diacylglycerol/lipid kinase family protein n=1 Tax=Geminicoccus sp. TaxID=2024832 RepID=UPI002C094CA2|nr:diacylglycerol kinase family protein [Geminicoccus sp.]HWL67778.1 diacylglycerol kinase family protein [Geminicoccus sp.]
MTLAATAALERVMRVQIIQNPTAGRRRNAKVTALAEALESMGIAVTVRLTGTAGDAEHLARQAAESDDRPDVLVAAGGDGTVNEVANGLLGSDLPLAILPTGTVNVLARELGIGGSTEEVARMVAAGGYAQVWPGLANGRAFLLMAGIGFDAAVVAAVSPAAKRRLGQLAYLLAAARLWWRWQPVHHELQVDGVRHRAVSAIAARCRLYGGSFVCAAGARLDEPHLHLVLFERSGRLAALGYALALATGQLHRWPGVRHLRTAGWELVTADHLQLDGDPVAATALSLAVSPQPLRIICTVH